MKRRDFLKNSLTAAAVTQVAAHPVPAPRRQYPSIKNLDDVITQEGDILVRVKFSSDSPRHTGLHTGQVRVKGAKTIAVTPFLLEAEDDLFDPTDISFRLKADKNHADVLVLRLKNTTNETRISIDTSIREISFTLGKLLQSGYLQFEQDRARIDVNFLPDKEIGEIDLCRQGIQNPPDDFCFHIFADPQGGEPLCPGNHRTRMRIHNAFLQDAIVLANHMPQRPLFTLMLGDIVDSQGQAENFAAMHRFWEKLDSPILYELGNHESRYGATFEPGYDMSAFTNYFAAQKKLNGMEKILYSFNAGQWHFVVWPDPLRSFFWENHPHYFQWLENDLKKYRDRPTFVFQHVPVHPIGINPFQGYLEHASVRKKFVDTVTRYGNVKYVLSGHVHIPVKSSLKTACSINGTNFITLPAAGYRPRGFGEQDYFGGPTQGIAVVTVRGGQARLMFKTVMEEEHTYPEKLPELDVERYKLWFNNKWEVRAQQGFRNGDFKNGLDGWIPEYVYQEDRDPSVICDVRQIDDGPALYLYNRIRGYQAPGQDRLPQTINRISQVISCEKIQHPVLTFQCKLDKPGCDLEGYCGGYVWIEGYEKSFRRFNLVYSAGVAYANPIAKGTEKRYDIHHFDLPAGFDWTDVSLHVQQDFDAVQQARRYRDTDIDRIVITLGVWTLNEGRGHSFGMYFRGFYFSDKDGGTTSQIDGAGIKPKDRQKIWWRGKHIPSIHLAGEHRYHLQTAKETLFRKQFERFER